MPEHTQAWRKETHRHKQTHRGTNRHTQKQPTTAMTQADAHQRTTQTLRQMTHTEATNGHTAQAHYADTNRDTHKHRHTHTHTSIHITSKRHRNTHEKHRDTDKQHTLKDTNRHRTQTEEKNTEKE